MADGAGRHESTVAWFHCFSGIAGDMAMGALIDAGADLDEVRSLCERLPISGWALEGEATMRTGIGGVKVHVHAEASTVVRTAAHISGMVEEARLPDRVREQLAARGSEARQSTARHLVQRRAEAIAVAPHEHRRHAEQRGARDACRVRRPHGRARRRRDAPAVQQVQRHDL